MPEIPDELAASLLELAEREVPPAGERFEAGLRQALRWEQRRRRSQRRWLVTAGCLTALCVALVVALALPAFARHLPLPVGHELRSLDAQTSDLQARLAAQAAVQASLLKQLSAQAVSTGRGRLVARHRAATRPRAAAPAAKSWSPGWAWVRPTASPGPGIAGPGATSPLGSSSSSSSPTPTPMPTPTPTATPTSP
jgi:hypothetical protein